MTKVQSEIRQAIVVRKQVNKVKKFFTETLGPGFVTGAADDDPSGVATFSQAGAQYGPHLMWMPLFVFPMMVCIQEMSARIGLVTHRGIIRIIKEEFPPLRVVAGWAGHDSSGDNQCGVGSAGNGCGGKYAGASDTHRDI